MVGALKSRVSWSAEWAFALICRGWRGLRPVDRSGTVLIATAGGGNTGDQALLEAFLDNTHEFVWLVTEQAGRLTIPGHHRSRATEVPLPHLTSSIGPRRVRPSARLTSLASRAKNCSVIGADVMDGGYDVNEALLRLRVLDLSRSVGASTSIMGFSWNGRADPRVERALARTARHATLFSRDPISADRLERAGIHNVVRTADMVFALDVSRTANSVPSSEPYAIVNVSGLLRPQSLLVDYLAVVGHLRQRGLAVVLLPHVVRGTDDDLAACREVAAHFATDARVRVLPSNPEPLESYAYARGAALVFTARMHLAVLSLLSGTPAIAVSTQGKVEGMLRLFDLAHLTIEPRSGFSVSVIDQIDAVMDDAGLRQRIRARAGDVTAMAHVQFNVIGRS